MSEKIFGIELPSVNVLPPANSLEEDPNYLPAGDKDILGNFDKLQKVRERMIQVHVDEFISSLKSQATQLSGQYQPVKHDKLEVGQIVMIKEPNSKIIDYPLGIVTEVTENDLGEVTEVVLKKGRTSEFIRRHSTSLVPLIKTSFNPNVTLSREENSPQPRYFTRQAARCSNAAESA